MLVKEPPDRDWPMSVLDGIVGVRDRAAVEGHKRSICRRMLVRSRRLKPVRIGRPRPNEL